MQSPVPSLLSRNKVLSGTRGQKLRRGKESVKEEAFEKAT